MKLRRIIAAAVSTAALLAVNVGAAETASAKHHSWGIDGKDGVSQTATHSWG